MIDKENLIEKISDFAYKIKKNKGLLVVVVILAVFGLVGMSSFTGNVISVNNLENELGISKAELSTCQKDLNKCATNLTEFSNQTSILKKNISAIMINLNKCAQEKDRCATSLETCSETKNNTQGKLDVCKKEMVEVIYDLTEQKNEYKRLSEDYEDLEKNYEKLKENFAIEKCCLLDYKYYSVTDEDNVLCCYKDGGDYFCGFGKGKETSENEINPLVC
ncbi:MAG: hypothetical protein KAU95_00175 [Candidatus Aenigmarchaeota archaeon]|nr:hypothetical protein [Candidatus Aenigmarchaeota archaeon]